jgi:hypothetical protein
MITQKTAYDIWVCYNEIEKGEKLLTEIKEALQRYKVPDLRDAFGHQQNLQLGVPCGDNSTRLFDVKPELAVCVITAHIGDKKAKLIALQTIARQELSENFISEQVKAAAGNVDHRALD